MVPTSKQEEKDARLSRNPTEDNRKERRRKLPRLMKEPGRSRKETLVGYYRPGQVQVQVSAGASAISGAGAGGC